MLSQKTGTRRKTLNEALTRLAPRAHLLAWRTTGGRVGSRLKGVEFCLLTTIGRLSQRLRTTPLVLVRASGQMVLVASNGGSDHHPAWLLNLLAEPRARLETRGARFEIVARLADAAERAELWPKVDEIYPGYRSYRAKTSREIPLVIVERRY